MESVNAETDVSRIVLFFFLFFSLILLLLLLLLPQPKTEAEQAVDAAPAAAAEVAAAAPAAEEPAAAAPAAEEAAAPAAVSFPLLLCCFFLVFVPFSFVVLGVAFAFAASSKTVEPRTKKKATRRKNVASELNYEPISLGGSAR